MNNRIKCYRKHNNLWYTIATSNNPPLHLLLHLLLLTRIRSLLRFAERKRSRQRLAGILLHHPVEDLLCVHPSANPLRRIALLAVQQLVLRPTDKHTKRQSR